jgi:nucleoid DNA-binding protein
MMKVDVEDAYVALMDIMAEALAKGEKVLLSGLGSFRPKRMRERMARNPRTGEPVLIPARVRATFTAGKDLLRAMR